MVTTKSNRSFFVIKVNRVMVGILASLFQKHFLLAVTIAIKGANTTGAMK